MRVNMKGVFLVGQAAARRMVEQVKAGKKPGAIVNMSSTSAVVVIANQVPYAASKGAVGQLTRVMALALAPYGIRVNAIGPGSIMTEILKSASPPTTRPSGGFCRARPWAASASRTRSPRSPRFSPRTMRAT